MLLPFVDVGLAAVADHAVRARVDSARGARTGCFL
jgi:hypothetical protein